jgi:hypothetical protein
MRSCAAARDVGRRSAHGQNAEADQVEPVDRAVAEVQFGVREFTGRLAPLVRDDLDGHDVRAVPFSAPTFRNISGTTAPGRGARHRQASPERTNLLIARVFRIRTR